VKAAIALTPQNTRERSALLSRFLPKIRSNPELNRTLVSFQANRKVPFYGWFKYKEGFSASLVDTLVRKNANSKGVLLDPFSGAGTALFVSRSLGWDSVGIEVLPVGPFVVETRLAAERVSAKAFGDLVARLPTDGWANHYDPAFALEHIAITKGAFSLKTDRAIAGWRSYVINSVRNPRLRILLDFACFSILESVSFTRKDGQYLRWDYRAKKERASSSFNKGAIPSFDDAIHRKLEEMYRDIASNGKERVTLFDNNSDVSDPGNLDLRIGSCLSELLDLESASIDSVFTSPPYCNRYDYTRTYALELVYLGYDSQAVKNLRQEMLSCTVENRSKFTELESMYLRRGRSGDFARVVKVFENQSSLQEVLQVLEKYACAGQLNNSNIPRLVKNYFFEMCFVVYELSRLLRHGGKIVIVNDNVRYGGEEVPVDLILSDFAEQFGLRVKEIWTLERGKGNSSQQMGLHGRTELRKCVYLWEKR